MENKFLTVIKENEIEMTEGQALASRFSIFMDKMADIQAEAKAIVITDVSQTKEMKKARELRLVLKDMRVESEKVRKNLKEDSLRRGKVIDALATIVKNTISPVEDYLELQEKYAENLEKQRIDRQNADRLEKLSKYADPVLYNYKDMSDETFESLLVQVETAYNAKIEAEKKAEVERIEKERLEKEEAERNKAELARMKAEEEERKNKAAKEEEAKRKAEAERKAKEEEMERKYQAELQKEREAREAIEKQQREKEEAERKAKEEADRKAAEEKRQAEEAERQKALAPEKDKLFAYAEAIKAIESPQGLSVAGLQIVKDAEVKLLAISQEIKESLKNL